MYRLTIKENTDKLDLIKTKNFYSCSDTIKREGQATEWEKIFAVPIPNKGHVSRVCKELQNQ